MTFSLTPMLIGMAACAGAAIGYFWARKKFQSGDVLAKAFKDPQFLADQLRKVGAKEVTRIVDAGDEITIVPLLHPDTKRVIDYQVIRKPIVVELPKPAPVIPQPKPTPDLESYDPDDDEAEMPPVVRKRPVPQKKPVLVPHKPSPPVRTTPIRRGKTSLPPKRARSNARPPPREIEPEQEPFIDEENLLKESQDDPNDDQDDFDDQEDPNLPE